MKNFLKNQKNHKDVLRWSLSIEEAKLLYWEDDKEFRYNGEMYDVIEKKAVCSFIIIRCISDKKETGLLNDYQKHHKHNPTDSAIVQLITTQFDLPADYTLGRPEKLIEQNFIDHPSSLQNIISSVFLPPPDVC